MQIHMIWCLKWLMPPAQQPKKRATSLPHIFSPAHNHAAAACGPRLLSFRKEVWVCPRLGEYPCSQNWII